jgi:hypothetical protein
MTGSGSPLLETPEDNRSRWLGGEAHVRYLGRPSLRARIARHFGSGPYSRLSLGLAFLTGGVLGAALIGVACRARAKRRSTSRS